MEQIDLIIPFIIMGLFSCLVGAFKGLSDYLMKTGEVERSSDNKYKLINGKKINAPTKGLKGLYYRLNNLKYVEKFPLSATLLVWWTDKWHKYNTFRMLAWIGVVFSSWFISFSFLNLLVWFVLFFIGRFLGFGITYKWFNK